MTAILGAINKAEIRFEEDDRSADAIHVSGRALEFVVSAIYEALVGSPMEGAQGYRLESVSGHIQIRPSKSTLIEDGVEYTYFQLSGLLDRQSARKVYKKLISIGLSCGLVKNAGEEDGDPGYEDQHLEEDEPLFYEEDYHLPYDESETPDWDNASGDLDNYWNEPGRLEDAVHEVADLGCYD